MLNLSYQCELQWRIILSDKIIYQRCRKEPPKLATVGLSFAANLNFGRRKFISATSHFYFDIELDSKGLQRRQLLHGQLFIYV